MLVFGSIMFFTINRGNYYVFDCKQLIVCSSLVPLGLTGLRVLPISMEISTNCKGTPYIAHSIRNISVPTYSVQNRFGHFVLTMHDPRLDTKQQRGWIAYYSMEREYIL